MSCRRRFLKQIKGIFVQMLARETAAATEGRKVYALRKQIPEPVFGIIKSVMGFLTIPSAWQGQGDILTLAWNRKRMFPLQSV